MESMKKRFYEDVIKAFPESELASVLKEQPECDFYELCRKFIDVGLNAPKCKGENYVFEASFQPGDMAAARDAAAEFIREYNIRNVAEFLQVLEAQYPHAVDPFDSRPKTATVMNDEYSFGMLFRFSVLPEDVFQEITKDLR